IRVSRPPVSIGVDQEMVAVLPEARLEPGSPLRSSLQQSSRHQDRQGVASARRPERITLEHVTQREVVGELGVERTRVFQPGGVKLDTNWHNLRVGLVDLPQQRAVTATEIQDVATFPLEG